MVQFGSDRLNHGGPAFTLPISGKRGARRLRVPRSHRLRASLLSQEARPSAHRRAGPTYSAAIMGSGIFPVLGGVCSRCGVSLCCGLRARRCRTSVDRPKQCRLLFHAPVCVDVSRHPDSVGSEFLEMPGKNKEKLQNRIRRLRFDHGEMTQQCLAEQVGVTRQTIIALEADKYVPSLLLAFRLAAAFSVRVEDVFQYESGSFE